LGIFEEFLLNGFIGTNFQLVRNRIKSIKNNICRKKIDFCRKKRRFHFVKIEFLLVFGGFFQDIEELLYFAMPNNTEITSIKRELNMIKNFREFKLTINKKSFGNYLMIFFT